MTGQDNLLKLFQTIPGVGPSLARDFVALGFSSVSELRGRDPEALYREPQSSDSVIFDLDKTHKRPINTG